MSETSNKGAMKVAIKDNVWHLVKRGMLMQLHFDMETFSLDPDFAQMMSYGDALGDIAGNMVSSQEIHVKRPDRYLSDIEALAVTRTNPRELDEENRTPHRTAMGKVGQTFEEGPHRLDKLPLKTIEARFETIRRYGGQDVRKPTVETVYEYPLKDAEGNELHDVRYHPDRKMIAYRFDTDPASPYYENVENNYYRDEDGSKWKFVEPRLLVSGFRIKWADIKWLRANLVKAGYHASNIFFTHSRATITNKQKPKNFASDAYSLAMATHVFGPQGEEGIKLGEKVDYRNGEEVTSATLSLIMEANTRLPNEKRGVRGGVVMPDGAIYTKEKAHRSPAYDSQASFAFTNYARDIAPDIVRDMELQADEQDLRRLLPGTDLDTPPIFSMLRNSYPMTYPLADPVTFLGFDDQLGQMRKAIMMRLDGNLRNYRYNGKTLKEMNGDDFAKMIREQARKPDALIRPESLRKWPGVIKLEDALQAGGGGLDWDFEQVDDNFRFLAENPDLCEAVRTGVEIINWETGHRPDVANPMMEEQGTRGGFGDLDYFEQTAEQEQRNRAGLKARGGRGMMPGIVETVYNKALDIYNYHRTLDTMLHSIALQPHPIDYSDDREDLENFRDLLRRTKLKLKKKRSPYPNILDKIDIKNLSIGRARKLRWDFMKRFMTDDLQERQKGDSDYAKGIFSYKYKAVVLDPLIEKLMDAAPVKSAGYAAGDATLETRLDEFKKLLKKAQAKLSKSNSPFKNIINNIGPAEEITLENIDQKHAALLLRLDAHVASKADTLDDTKENKLLFGNLSRNFRIVDEGGRELTMDYLKHQHASHPNIVLENFMKRKWQIQFYQLSSKPSLTAALFQFADMGRLDELPESWRKEYAFLQYRYLQGKPNIEPSKQPFPCIPRIKHNIKSLKINARVDGKEGLTRVFSEYRKGKGDIFITQDESQKIIADYEEYLEEIEKKHPLVAAFERATNYDPVTGLPYDWIAKTIDAKNTVTIDVPDAHLRQPLDDIRISSPYALVIPAVSKEDKKKIANGAAVLLRGQQTGRTYYPGPVDIKEAPVREQGYGDFYDQAIRAYVHEAGVAFPKKPVVLIIQAPVPVAQTRPDLDASVQSVKVPSLFFDALTNPRLAHFRTDKPLTGLVLPVAYCPQTLETGKPVRFREMETPLGAKLSGINETDTGHVYDSILTSLRRIKIRDLQALGNDEAQRHGYAGAFDMWEKTHKAFVDQDSPDADEEEIYLLEFTPVEKESWAYFNPQAAPKAALSYDGLPVPPSAYRPARQVPPKIDPVKVTRIESTPQNNAIIGKMVLKNCKRLTEIFQAAGIACKPWTSDKDGIHHGIAFDEIQEKDRILKLIADGKLPESMQDKLFFMMADGGRVNIQPPPP